MICVHLVFANWLGGLSSHEFTWLCGLSELLNRENDNTNRRGHGDVTFFCWSHESIISALHHIQLECSFYSSYSWKRYLFFKWNNLKNCQCFPFFLLSNVRLSSWFLWQLLRQQPEWRVYVLFELFSNISKETAEQKLTGRWILMLTEQFWVEAVKTWTDPWDFKSLQSDCFPRAIKVWEMKDVSCSWRIWFVYR